MTPAAQLAALRRRAPDSIAPDGQPLRFVLRGIEQLSEDEKRVIVERRTGWEKCDHATLARNFCVHPTTITHVLKQYGTQATGGVS